MSKLSFPEGFVWGAATSSYQIEGATRADGRGEANWDVFSHISGNILNGDTGDVACDHYNRWREDIGLMRSIGLNSYRFSIAWSRIFPDGDGKVNQKGLDFYSRLIDGLLEAGITPLITLYHWDYPWVLENEGAWRERPIVDKFAHYTDVVSRAYGDRAQRWATHNEPAVAAYLGHWNGVHSPGKKDFGAALRAAHHLLLSHGTAVPIIRANVPDAQVGIVLNINHTIPVSDSDQDYARYRFVDGYRYRMFLDPIFGRGYPPDVINKALNEGCIKTPDLDGAIQDGDMEKIATPIDFLGINFYRRDIAPPYDTILELEDNSTQFVNHHPDCKETTGMGWDIYPEGLFKTLSRVHWDYMPKSIYITENGASFTDTVTADGQIRDARRLNYIKDHLAQIHRAIQTGIPVDGYYVWSLIDNFEWAKGYSQRFGIVHVDFETQKRTPKDSALWYKQVIAANAVVND